MKRKTKAKNKAKAKENKPVFHWKASQDSYTERGSKWKIFAILGLLVLVAWGVLTGAWTFSLVVVAFAFTYYIINKGDNKKIEVNLYEGGVKVADKVYLFHNIKNFWIVYYPPKVKTLHFHVKGDIWGEVKVNLDEQNPYQIQEFLRSKVPEITDKHESLSDIILRILKI